MIHYGVMRWLALMSTLALALGFLNWHLKTGRVLALVATIGLLCLSAVLLMATLLKMAGLFG
jgi:hypothetical protein